MFSIWYLMNTGKREKAILNKLMNRKEPDWDYDFYGDPPHSFAGSAQTAMELMLIMAAEGMTCLMIDLLLATLIIVMIV